MFGTGRYMLNFFPTHFCQQLWQTFLSTGSAADLVQRPERRVITAAKIFTYFCLSGSAWWIISQTNFWNHGRHISDPWLTN